MNKRLTAMLLALLVALSSVALLAAQPAPEAILNNQINQVNAATNNETALAAVENASDSVSRSVRNAFSGALQDEFAQLDALRATCKTNWENIRIANIQNKQAMESFRRSLRALPINERRAKVDALAATLQPLHASVNQVQADIKTLRTQKNTQWTSLRLAVRAKDQTAAETALNSILGLKSSIITKQGDLLALKKQISDAIAAAAAAVIPPAPATTSSL